MTTRTLMRPEIKTQTLLTNGASRVVLVDGADLRGARGPRESSTIFLRQVPTEAEAAMATRAVIGHAVVAPRRGEYLAAPFPVADKIWSDAGTILQRVGAVTGSSDTDTRVQLADEVEIAAPRGANLQVGDRLVSVRQGEALGGGASVARPTGVLVVTRAAAGEPLRATVRSVSGAISASDVLLVPQGEAAPSDHEVIAVSGADLETQVQWLDSAELLPTLQSFLLLGVRESDGVKAGDHFELSQKTSTGDDERIAVVRVVRVDALGSSAVVIQQSQPRIARGVTARRIARAP